MSHIDGLVKNNYLKDVKQAIKKAKKKGFDTKRLEEFLAQSKGRAVAKAPSKEQPASLLEHYQRLQFDVAKKLSISMTHESHMHQFGWKVLGAVLQKTGRVIDSLSAL